MLKCLLKLIKQSSKKGTFLAFLFIGVLICTNHDLRHSVIHAVSLNTTQHLATENVKDCCTVSFYDYHNIKTWFLTPNTISDIFSKIGLFLTFLFSPYLIKSLFNTKEQKLLLTHRRYRKKSLIFNQLNPNNYLYSTGILNPKLF